MTAVSHRFQSPVCPPRRKKTEISYPLGRNIPITIDTHTHPSSLGIAPSYEGISCVCARRAPPVVWEVLSGPEQVHTTVMRTRGVGTEQENALNSIFLFLENKHDEKSSRSLLSTISELSVCEWSAPLRRVKKEGGKEQKK